jgi:hypothetical protein
MKLEQVMAFTVTDDQARQEQVWDGLANAYNKEPYYIRRQLTESVIRASDKRARFVDLKAYEAAGGIVMRDLFEQDNGGWLQDSALLDRLLRSCTEALLQTAHHPQMPLPSHRGRAHLVLQPQPSSRHREGDGQNLCDTHSLKRHSIQGGRMIIK